MAYVRGKRDIKQVNTVFKKFYNQNDGDDSSVMTLGGWSQMYTLSIAKMLPDDVRTESSVYDYEKQISFMFNDTRVSLFNKAVNNVFDAYMKMKKDIKASKKDSTIKIKEVPSYSIINDTMRLEIGFSSKKYGSKHYDGLDERLYIMIYSTKESNKMKSVAVGAIMYVFEPVNVKSPSNCIFKNYDERNGDHSGIEVFESDFMSFKNTINVWADLGMMCTSHGVLQGLNYRLTGIETELEKIKGISELGIGKSNFSGGTSESSSRRYRDSSSNTGVRSSSRLRDSSFEDDEETEERSSSRRSSGKKSSNKKSKTTEDEVEELLSDEDEE